MRAPDVVSWSALYAVPRRELPHPAQTMEEQTIFADLEVLQNNKTMRPIIIVPPDQMSDDDIKLLRDNQLCVVVAKDPARVKFVDPIPAISSRTEIEDAAIKLSRKVFAGDLWGPDGIKAFADMYVKVLIKGTPLDPHYIDPVEVDKQTYNYAHAEEIRKMAREDARAEKAAKQAKKAEEALKAQAKTKVPVIEIKK